MKNGVYALTFTTTDGVMGNGVCMVYGDVYVGVDFTQSYYGEIRRYGATCMVDMHVARHAYLRDVALKLAREFSISWSGTAMDDGFDLEARIEETGDLVRSVGTLLRRPDGSPLPFTPPAYLKEAVEKRHPLAP
jgi:hypothetical protein